MGSLGEKKTVTIKVVSRRGGYLEEKITFQPALVDLMWEANTYTPPFYKGKALTSSKSSITVTAIPQLKTSDKKILDPNFGV